MLQSYTLFESQDVLFDEARTHGAGFYRFSRDEVTRAAEQEELKDMHEETKKVAYLFSFTGGVIR